MKIAIIGGGISGCTTYLFLKKHLPTSIESITIYEAYATPHSPDPSSEPATANAPPTPVIGGGLALAPNGLGVLSRLDPSQSLVKDIARSGYAISTMAMKTKSGALLAEMDAASSPMLVPDAFLSPGTRSDAESGPKYSDENRPKLRMNTIASSRHALWGSLRARVPDEDVVNRRVRRVIPRADGLNVVQFEGEGEGVEQVEVDLVIGADGLRSVTRRGMFSKSKEGEDEEYEYGPRYEGLIGIGGFTTLSPSLKEHLKPGTMSLLFSGNGFFGYYPSSSPPSPNSGTVSSSPYTLTPPSTTLTWWSTYAHPSPPPTPSTISLSSINADLKSRHSAWTDPIIQSILSSLSVQNIYPTWTSPVLPTWEAHGVVLVGDAAHALPSTSGQGASMGVEDAECFSLFLVHSLSGLGEGGEDGDGDGERDGEVVRTKRVITQAARQYIDLRKPRVERILNDAQRKQNGKRDVGWVGEKVMYVFLWILGEYTPLRALLWVFFGVRLIVSFSGCVFDAFVGDVSAFVIGFLHVLVLVEAGLLLTIVGLFPGRLSRANKEIVDYNVAEDVDRVLGREKES